MYTAHETPQRARTLFIRLQVNLVERVFDVLEYKVLECAVVVFLLLCINKKRRDKTRVCRQLVAQSGVRSVCFTLLCARLNGVYVDRTMCMSVCLTVYVDDPNWIKPLALDARRSTEIVRTLTDGNAKACTITNLRTNIHAHKQLRSDLTTQPRSGCAQRSRFLLLLLFCTTWNIHWTQHSYCSRRRNNNSHPTHSSLLRPSTVVVTMVFGGKFRITRLDTDNNTPLD